MGMGFVYVLLTMLGSAGGILLSDWLKRLIYRERRPGSRRSLK